MAEQHTAEPWELILHGDERYPYPLSIHAEEGNSWVARDGTVSSIANARRIVAAVNACKGITTEELERVDIGGLNKIVIALEATLPKLE